MLFNLIYAKLVWMPSVCYIPTYYLQKRAGCETPILEVAGSKRMRSKALPIQGLFLSFHISFHKTAFWSCSRQCLRSAALRLFNLRSKLEKNLQNL